MATPFKGDWGLLAGPRALIHKRGTKAAARYRNQGIWRRRSQRRVTQKIHGLYVVRELHRISGPVSAATVTPMNEASPSQWPAFGRGLAILLTWHVVVAGIAVLLLYGSAGNDDDCVAYECLFNDDRRLMLWLSVVITGIPTLMSLIVAVPTLAILVWRAEWPPLISAGTSAFAGLVFACTGGLFLLGLE